MNAYLKQVQKEGYTPNFWMSEEYIRLKGLQISSDGDYWGLVDPTELNQWFFPPVNQLTAKIEWLSGPPYYCGLPILKPSGGASLDVQYIYDPKSFLNLSGGKWEAFRKKVHRYSYSRGVQQNTFHQEYRRPLPSEEDQIIALVMKWAEGRNVFDPDTIVDYSLRGENRWGLFYDKQLVGLNVADNNWQFINFRYCFDNGEENLQAYLRYLFYISSWVQSKGMLVNDGGDLGNKGLAQFKKYLNPMNILPVFTTIPETEEPDGD